MKNIEIKINKNTRMVTLSKTTLGNEGESQQYNLVFSFEDEFVNGQARLEYEIENQEKQWIPLEKDNESYYLPVLNVLTNKGQINMQLVIDEIENSMPVFKSNIFYLYCNESINAINKAPEGYELWIEQANSKLNEVENIDIDIQDSIVTIYKKDGSVKAENVKGEKGETGEKGKDGSIHFMVVNELPTEDIDESAIYMLPSETPDEKNTYEEYIYTDGSWEHIGGASVRVDLDNYPTREEVEQYVDDAIANAGGGSTGGTPFAYYYPTIIEIGTNNASYYIDYSLYKPECVKAGAFLPIVLMCGKSSGHGWYSVTLQPIIQNKKLVGFAGTGIQADRNYNTTPTIIHNWVARNLDIASVDAMPNSGSFNITHVEDQQILAVTNQVAYDVTKDYQPAHKKYVDTAIANAITNTLEGNY